MTLNLIKYIYKVFDIDSLKIINKSVWNCLNQRIRNIES